jgi:hypothetical protein
MPHVDGLRRFTFAPRLLNISDHRSPEHAPSSVLTSTNATTPFRAVLPVEDDIKAAIDRSPSSIIDTSAPTMEERGRCTLLILDDDGMDTFVLALLAAIWSGTSARMVGTLGFRIAEGPGLELALLASLRTFNFAKASLSPANLSFVSAVKPSRLEADDASDGRGPARGTGSETDLMVGLSSTSIESLVEDPSGAVKDRGTWIGPEISRGRG